MKRYYVVSPGVEMGVIEVTEAEIIALIGTEKTRPYATKVYRGEMIIEEVPEDLQEAVQTVVNNKIARWGEYNKQPINSNEFQTMIEEVL